MFISSEYDIFEFMKKWKRITTRIDFSNKPPYSNDYIPFFWISNQGEVILRKYDYDRETIYIHPIPVVIDEESNNQSVILLPWLYGGPPHILYEEFPVLHEELMQEFIKNPPNEDENDPFDNFKVKEVKTFSEFINLGFFSSSQRFRNLDIWGDSIKLRGRYLGFGNDSDDGFPEIKREHYNNDNPEWFL